MAAYRLTRPAQSDIVSILSWSYDQFGADAQRRYRALIRAAIDDVASEPMRAGSKARPDLGADVRTWHLRLSRDRCGAERVRHPRHLLLFTVDSGVTVIGRVLHDSMDPARRVGPDS